MKSLLFLILTIGAVIVGSQAIFILPEGRQAVITQFGAPVGNPIVEPGPHFKTPFVQDVRYIEKRILLWDGYPNQIPTKDKKFISVDTTARWKIIDPLLFIQTVRTERGARDKLDSILDGSTRNAISGHNLVEVVRNSNKIIEQIKERKKSEEEGDEGETSVELESITIGREALSQMIVKESNKRLKELGVEVIDVQFRRVAYDSTVVKKVYERMSSERERIAEKIRSIGRAEKAKIEGRLAKELQLIQSQSYKKAQLIKGKAEGRAVKIYADSIRQAPRFYEFLRTMEAYEKSLKAETKYILSPGSKFLKYLD